MTIFARSSWQDPALPVTGPPRKAPFRQGVVHWEGIVRDQTPTDIAAHLRQMQGAYLSSRGYSLGYGYAVVSDARHRMDGSVWEIRGRDINMASNPGRKWNAEGRKPSGNANDWTGSVLLVGPTGVHVSDKAAASVRDLFAAWHAEAGTTPVAPFPHSELDYTACCGPAYLADLNAGLFVPTPPLPPTAPLEDDMPAIAYILQPPPARTGSPWLVVVDADVRPATSYDLNSGKLPVHQETNQYAVEQYDSLRLAAGV